MATGKKQYVYRLMKAQCSCGSKNFKQNLNLPKDHGVLFRDNESPLMNANDHIANEHILTFGRCTSMTNPNGAMGFLVASAVIPIIGGALMKKLAGVKCEPMTIVPWIKVDEDYLIDGAPALTLESELPCYYGGTIKVVLEKVNDEDDEDAEDDEEEGTEAQEAEEEKDIKKQLPSEVQEKLDSFCDDEQTVVQSAGEDAIAAEEQAKAEKQMNAFHGGNPLEPIEVNKTIPYDTYMINEFQEQMFGERVDVYLNDEFLYNQYFEYNNFDYNHFKNNHLDNNFYKDKYGNVYDMNDINKYR